MRIHVDDRFAAAGDTLLLYTGGEDRVSVPSCIDGERIRRIGSRAFRGGTGKPSEIYLEDGIEEIGEKAFEEKIHSLRLPSTLKSCAMDAAFFQNVEELSAGFRWEKAGMSKTLLSASVRMGERHYLCDTEAVPGTRELAGLIDVNLFPVFRAGEFFFKEKNFLCSSVRRYEAPEGFSLAGARVSEADAVRELIRKGGGGFAPGKGETRTDWAFRCGADLNELVAPSAVCWFTDKDVRAGEGCTAAEFHLERGYFFCPQMRKIRNGRNEEYYLYSRLYPVREESFRVDMAVFDSAGRRVTEEKKAQEIYAKGRLTALI